VRPVEGVEERSLWMLCLWLRLWVHVVGRAERKGRDEEVEEEMVRLRLGVRAQRQRQRQRRWACEAMSEKGKKAAANK
jgi:hypothetical protein